jgi:acyl-coenzyme A synthetase/AMP-(fatty) acid ligase
MAQILPDKKTARENRDPPMRQKKSIDRFAGTPRHRKSNPFGDLIASEAAFRDGWFVTGDLGSVSPEGWVSIQGRASEVINAGGVKVSPDAIEEALLAHPAICDAAAFGFPDSFGVDEIWAAIVTAPDTDLASVTAACRARVGNFTPRFLLLLTQIPRNENGKIVRRELMRLAREKQAAEKN